MLLPIASSYICTLIQSFAAMLLIIGLSHARCGCAVRLQLGSALLLGLRLL